jgi:fibronectin type 3 domain-containing protein
VAAGSTWKYRDNGSNQGTAWKEPSFDDSSWPSGPAQLGYGDGDEATVVSYGPDPNQKYVTTYFRRSFNVGDPGAYNSLNLETKRDDGAVVYLNGVEIWRSNMPATWGYQTLAAADAGNSESQFVAAAIDVSRLVAGTNVLAVEIHQNDRASSDISFDLRLIASTDAPFALLTRGPYLQMGTPSSVRVRWRTDLATNSQVRYGSSPTALTSVVNLPASVTDHEVILTGLTPATRYYYSVGSSSQVIAGGDSTYYFVTSPLVGAATPTRIWILGDSGTANNDARAVRDAYLGYAGSTHTNLWLMLGDNAYTYGTDEDYQYAVFDMYPTMLRKSVLWPTIGNHDTAEVPSAPPSLPYFAMFSLPTAGEAGGVASGTEKYYSFDYGNIHFICLDSMVSDRSPTGPMLTWLQNDLESTSQQWIIAYFHHPPYSKGSHDSDVDIELREMRQNALPILEGYGVDLVLSGHSHSYERSFLIDSHYGNSSSFISSMKKDGGNGRVDGTGAYDKSSPGIAPHEGAVYVVAGSSGLVQPSPLNHPAMYIGLNNLGSMVLDVTGNRLDAKFLRENGAIGDYFTIIKGAVDAPTTLSATAISATRIDLQWTDAANNEDGFRIERCTGTAATCNANPASFALLAEGAANATTYSDTTAAASTTYSYRVRAFNSAASSTYTNTAAATTPAALQPPAAPSALTATASSTTQVNLAWTDNATNEDGYRVERCTGTWTACEENTAMFTQIAQLAADTSSYPDTGRTPGETYTYRVRAFNAAGNSAYSDSEEVTLPAPPPAPATLAATAISTTQINLTWSDLTTSEEGFRVERCTGTAATCDANPASYAQIAELAANTTSYPDTGRTPGTTYTYRVRAFNTGGGNSPYSNSASATTPAPPSAPTTLAATAISTTQINLTWTDTATTEDGFRVERCTGTAATCDANPESYAQIAELAADTTSYPDTGRTAGTTYTYRVRAFNTAGGNSPYSNSASATTPAPPSAPTSLTATSASSSQINLTWTDTATTEDGFRVERCTGSAATCNANPASYGQIALLAANTTSYTSTGLTGGTTYSYRVFATNGSGDSAPSNTATATTPAACVPAAITEQPHSTTTNSGSSTTLSVTATGTAPLSYQWYTGPSGNTASPMTGRTSATLTVSPTTTTSYWVRVTNGCGSVDSSAATVTVNPPPVVTTRGDFNRDGRADLFWRNTAAGSNFVWFMNGSTVTQTTSATAPAPWAPVVFADFNGDGRADVLWRQPNTGETSIWLMNGATYSSAVRSVTLSDTNWTPVGSGDFNGDGKADIFWRNSATGVNSIWMMDGTTVTQQAVVRVPATWDVALTGDMNADGKADVYWRDRTTGETSIWLMNGAVYTTAVRSTTVTDLNWQPVVGGDFDADGNFDLFWRNRATGQTSVWLMNGTTVRSTTSLITVPTSWSIRGAGDYNADAKADVFWWNATTGETSVWLMNGAGAPATFRLPTVSTTFQPVLGR